MESADIRRRKKQRRTSPVPGQQCRAGSLLHGVRLGNAPSGGHRTGRRVGTEPHTHDYDEVIAFIGTDLNDPYDLGAEVELWLDDEKHIINKSCLVYIPAGLKHCPLTFLRVDRPVFHYTTGPAKMYF